MAVYNRLPPAIRAVLQEVSLPAWVAYALLAGYGEARALAMIRAYAAGEAIMPLVAGSPDAG